MPSKSKAQARFFAAAAHNPDFAKKAGISSSAAKEWNQADKKAGTLKKGSKKPERVKEEILDEEILDEASGVGNFPIPPSSMKLIRKYASSILLTYAYKSYQKYANSTDDDELDKLAAKKILPFLQRFQKKFDASVLNDASMKRYVNQSISVPLDHEAVFNELPKSLQTEKVHAIINKMRLFITFDARYGSRAGGHARQINANTTEIVLALHPSYYEFSVAGGTDSLENTMHQLQYFMSGIDHEVQHAFQQIVTAQVSSENDKNREQKQGYGSMDDAYFASGVEFGPQTQDMINIANHWLEIQNDEGKLSGKPNVDISNAIKYVMNRMKTTQGRIYKALMNYKEDGRAKKHLALIYKGIAKEYENILNQEEHGDLDLEPKEVDGGDAENRVYHSNTNGPDDEADPNNPMVKIYRKLERYGMLPYSIEEKREHGKRVDITQNPYNDPSNMVYATTDGGIVRFWHRNNVIEIQAWSDGKNPSDGNMVSVNIPEDKVSIVIDNSNMFDNFKSIENFTKTAEQDMNAVTMSIDEIADQFQSWYDNAAFWYDDTEGKGLNFELDEGTVFFNLKGTRYSMYIQEALKDAAVLYNTTTEEEIGYIKYSDLEEVMTSIFSLYFQGTERQFNRLIKNLGTSSGYIDMKSLDETWKYVVDSSKKPVEESSMRGFMDLVQDAEIADSIDQADKMTLSNLERRKAKKSNDNINQLGEEEQLDEMPQRFDSFQGQNPDEFVDKTAELTGKSNLVPFSEHPNFTVMRNKNYTGFIAFDKEGKQIAVVSGHLSQDAVLGVKNVFEVAATASKTSVKGVMYQIFMDMINAGISVLSDTLHSDSAIKFWTRLISSHNVYVVGDGEVLAKATPEKVHKYWSDDENSPSAELQLLLTK
ncbi:hypothetical protein KU599_07145 [Salmonella enterica subsp. enterica serovar Mbandaka]|nr:hypothetical protein [Salmonella enterica subsp. enterica serovar Mbandaka]